MLWYILNLSIILVFLILFLITRQTNRRWSKINDYLGMVTNTVNSVRYGNLSTKIEEINHPTYQNVTDSINRMVETLNDREKMIVEYQAELMRQNKLLESVINSLSDGILIINDKYNILRATPKVGTWFGLKGQEIIGTNIFDYIQISDDTSIERIKAKDVFIKHTPTNNFIMSSIKLSLDDDKKSRILAIINPEMVSEAITWQQDRGLIAIGNGGLWGNGIFMETGQFRYVPEVYNDFIFTYIGETVGFIGCIAVLAVLAFICIRILYNGLHACDEMGKYICVGVFALIGIQIIINIGMCLKLLPVIGVTLPFLSAGGTSTGTLYLAIGVVLSVHMHSGKDLLFG